MKLRVHAHRIGLAEDRAQQVSAHVCDTSAPARPSAAVITPP
jgi:hypothetical protein